MKTIVSSLIIFVCGFAFAQLEVSTELRPRFEYRNGYKTLSPDDADAAAFVSQRTRLNSKYKTKNLELFLSVQDTRTWGDVKQLNTSDKNGFMVHQAWGKFNLSEDAAVKVGRQVISYDDQRFFGGVGWAQQSRSHDAALFQYNKDAFKMDIGLAFNQDGENIFGTTLNTAGTYKALQYAWLHKDWTNFSGSLLLANLGWQHIEDANQAENETRFNQTVGTHLKYKKDKLNLAGNLFYQFGKDIANNDLSAYLLGLEMNYSVSNKILLGVGGEIQSGNDNGTITDNKNNAFTPFFGTNHKFNGLMDYFYVGNHANSIGLVNLFAKANFKLNDKSKLGIAIHNFSSAADFQNKQLGNEIDITFGYDVQKNVNLSAGYSHMLPAEGMKILKGTDNKNSNNWAWIMLTINPTLFTSSK